MKSDEPRRPTIYDVASRAGVSKSLVSLVLRGAPGVSDARRAEILAAISELGYRPSQAATMLASTRPRSIEVLVDDYRNQSFVGTVEGVRSVLAGTDFYLTVTETRLNSVSVAGGAYSQSSPADGRVLAGEPTQAVLAGWTVPTVVAGSRLSVPAGADVVATDDAKGSRLACGHLHQLGHRRIGHLSGSSGPAVQRLAGYEAFCRDQGLEIRAVGVDDGTTEEDGYRSAVDLFGRHPDITAVVAANDVMALGALAAIRERGLSVPGDVSLVGYDNTPLAQSRYLSLTTVDDHSAEVGGAATRALLARLADPAAAQVHQLIAPTLIARSTTGPARP